MVISKMSTIPSINFVFESENPSGGETTKSKSELKMVEPLGVRIPTFPLIHGVYC